MARLTSPDGVAVEVADDLVEEMLRRGFTVAGKAEPAKKSAPRKSTK